MSSPAPSRGTLEDLWKQRIQEAHQEYQRAKSACAQALEEQASGRIPVPDGHYALLRALRMEAAATSEYTRVLRIFNDLVVCGKTPKEPLYP